MSGGNPNFDHQLMMFRLNLWASKPYLHGVPHLGGMENSAYLPNPMASPGLMVLASSEANTRDSNGHAVASHSSDKERSVPFTSSFPVFRQGEHFPTPMYSPFVRPDLAMNQAFLNASNSSAFRPVLTPDGESYHSAFLPTKRKHEETSPSSSGQTVAIDYSDHKNPMGRCNEERPLSGGSCDTSSDIHSEADSLERATPDEGRSLRKQRKRVLSDGHTPCCPVCGITLRPGEVEGHFAMEMEKLDKITRSSKKSYSPKTVSHSKKSQSTLSPLCGPDTMPIESTNTSRHETFGRIRNNRLNRLAARCKTKKRRGEESTCPVCSEKLYGSPEELNDHVEHCLKQNQHRSSSGEDDPVDIEGEYEEYTWAGQTRIRATTLLPGGSLAGAGFTMGVKRQEEDEDLVVDGDEPHEYGPQQFTEADVIPCLEDKDENTPLRDAVLQCESSNPSHTTNGIGSRLDEQGEVSTTADHDPADSTLPAGIGEGATKIIESLKARLKCQVDRTDRNKCLICMENYTKPLTSIQCWHVYCSQCWLRTLGAKKLCPQCNMITSPSHLRLIYL